MIAHTTRQSRLVDLNGNPLSVVKRAEARELGELVPRQHPWRRDVQASYDAARTSTEFENYWANADSYDADSANSRAVRQVLVKRSRYEVGNNGYADGIAQTYATDLIGLGPSLRMQSRSEGFNRMVEFEWARWSKAIGLRRKLWTMAHAKYVDGEAFGVIRPNRGLRHPVGMDLILTETDQCQTPWLQPFREGMIDGVEFDRYGNPTIYHFLRTHPGSIHEVSVDLETEPVTAAMVAHWFKLRRPGQHRGVPEATSTLNTGAASRRWREATLAAAETAADFSVLLKTSMDPDTLDPLASMSTTDIQKRMMTALPQGWDAFQMRSEHPATTYAEFMRTHISEQARPKSMPYNKAACDSSSYNYASGRLDHQTYYASLDVDRADCDDAVMDVIFAQWFPRAIEAFGWLLGDPMRIEPAAFPHSWDWPKHQVADLQAEANSVDKRLRNGSLSLSRHYSEMGRDFGDEVTQLAADYGIEVDEMRKILLQAVFNQQNQQASMQTAENQAEADNAEA